MYQFMYAQEVETVKGLAKLRRLEWRWRRNFSSEFVPCLPDLLAWLDRFVLATEAEHVPESLRVAFRSPQSPVNSRK